MIFTNGGNWVEILLSVFALVACLSYVSATLIYLVAAPWQKTWVGRLMLLKLSVTAVSFILILFLREAWWVQAYRDQIRMAIFGGFAVAGVGLFLALWQNYRNNRRIYRGRASHRANAVADTVKSSSDITRKGTAMDRQIAVPSTQIQFPNRSMWRTMVQAAVPAFLSGVVLLPWIIDVILDGYGQDMPDPVRAWLIGFAAFITVTAGVVARIMSNPAVDLWIRQHIKKLAPSEPEAAKPVPVAVEPENPTPPVPQEPAAPLADEQPETFPDNDPDYRG